MLVPGSGCRYGWSFAHLPSTHLLLNKVRMVPSAARGSGTPTNAWNLGCGPRSPSAARMPRLQRGGSLGSAGLAFPGGHVLPDVGHRGEPRFLELSL